MTKREDALDYHSRGRPGKIAVVPTKPLNNQRDLSLAYSPGVAEPCLAIRDDPGKVNLYTNRPNTVAVVTNEKVKASMTAKRKVAAASVAIVRNIASARGTAR